MARRSVLGLLLLCVMAATRTVVAQEGADGSSGVLMFERALEIAREEPPIIGAARARIVEAQGLVIDAEVLRRRNPTLGLHVGPRVDGDEISPAIDVDIGFMFELQTAAGVLQ